MMCSPGERSVSVVVVFGVPLFLVALLLAGFGVFLLPLRRGGGHRDDDDDNALRQQRKKTRETDAARTRKEVFFWREEVPPFRFKNPKKDFFNKNKKKNTN